MIAVEERLKNLILENYKSIREFTTEIGIPYSTFDSILKRGISNANITNILKITNKLDIDTEKLAMGEIVKNSQPIPQTIAAHFNGDEYTEEELDKIKEFAAFVKSGRKK